MPNIYLVDNGEFCHATAYHADDEQGDLEYPLAMDSSGLDVILGARGHRPEPRIFDFVKDSAGLLWELYTHFRSSWRR